MKEIEPYMLHPPRMLSKQDSKIRGGGINHSVPVSCERRKEAVSNDGQGGCDQSWSLKSILLPPSGGSAVLKLHARPVTKISNLEDKTCKLSTIVRYEHKDLSY
jgi:hypothetical protein